MNSTRRMKVGCTVLLFMFLVCCQRASEEPRLTAIPVATIDSKVILREGLIQALGTERLTKISYSKPEAGDITITWAIENNDLRPTTKAAAQSDATTILKILKDSKSRFIYVVLIGTISMPDPQGQITETQVLSLGFNKSKLDKVAWEDFQPSDIFNLADVVSVIEEWQE